MGSTVRPPSAPRKLRSDVVLAQVVRLDVDGKPRRPGGERFPGWPSMRSIAGFMNRSAQTMVDTGLPACRARGRGPWRRTSGASRAHGDAPEIHVEALGLERGCTRS